MITFERLVQIFIASHENFFASLNIYESQMLGNYLYKSEVLFCSVDL